MSNVSDTNSSAKVSGSCACRRIIFESASLGQNPTTCYCRECAKIAGSGYITFLHFRRSDVTWSQTPDIWKSSERAVRGYCRTCGSAVHMDYLNDQEMIYVAMSMIDYSSEPLPRATKHYYVKEKANWVYMPDDGSEKFETE